jgi:PAS domain S-box-containing protein
VTPKTSKLIYEEKDRDRKTGRSSCREQVGRGQAEFIMIGADTRSPNSRTRAEEAFASVQETLLESSPHAVLLVRPDWSIDYANSRAVKLAQNANLLGTILWSAFPELAATEAQAHCRRALEERVEVEFEQRMSNDQWLQVCARPHEDKMALYCRDITRFKLAEQALHEREAELSDFFENGNVPLHWVGPDGVIIWANDAELAMLGYRADEYIGRSIKEFHVDRPVIEDILCRLTNNEKLHAYESRIRRKDGSIRNVAINSSVYRKDGVFVHTRCFTRDITEDRSKAEIQARLAAIVDSSDDAIISKDLNGIITSWNKSAERLFGYTAEEAVGQPVAKLLIPDDRQDEEPQILSRLRAGERVDHFQTKRKRKDGNLLEISLTISPVKNLDGQIVGASKIARDITPQVRDQEALRRANDALEQSNADLEQFAYSASHDLQEPLRMISAYGEMLRKKYIERLDENAQEYIGFIVEGALRMERLLGDLRAFTRAAVGPEGAIPAIDSQAVLKSAIANLKATIDENEAEITYDSLPSVSIHQAQLEQVFQNISETRSGTGGQIHHKFT